MRSFILAATAAAAALIVAPQIASAMPSASLGPTATVCSLSDISPTAGECAGWYSGNLNGGSPTDDARTLLALSALEGTTVTTFSVLAGGDFSGPIVDFGKTLYGDTIVSFHVGAGKGEPTGVGYESTAFYEFNAGAAGLSSLTFNRAGLSNARLFSTGECTVDCGGGGVPEPASWALMLVGFGGLGAVMRSRRKLASAA